MGVDRTYFCDGPDCGDGSPCGATTATPPPYLPGGFIEARSDDGQHFFCGWDCLMKFAANQPIPERIELDGGASNAQ